MQISFYCEFPTEKTLKKLKLIKFPCRIFLAAKSVQNFETISKKAKKINKKIKTVYWPIVKNSYWISPFSNTNDLTKLFKELNDKNNDVLIDLEPPILNKKLFLKNILKIRKNKKIIHSFLEKNKKRTITAQLPFPDSRIMRFLGLDYEVKTEKNLMFYSSMIPEKIKNKIKNRLLKITNKEHYSIGLGVIAKGILKKEPILSPEALKKDFQFVKKAGFKKVIIFRVGGLNEKYLRIINKFH